MRCIDTAAMYGNEAQVGQGLKKLCDEGVVRREELFIMGKLNNNDHANVKEACCRSLQQLNCGYFDAYLMHWPVSNNRGAAVQPPLIDTWRAMEACVDNALCRALGVCNFSVKKLQALCQAGLKHPVSMLQAERHAGFRNDALVDYCNKQVRE